MCMVKLLFPSPINIGVPTIIRDKDISPSTIFTSQMCHINDKIYTMHCILNLTSLCDEYMSVK